MEHLKAYKEHCIDQAMTDPVGRPRHQVHVHHAEAARGAWPCALEERGRSIRKTGITGIFSGGTEMTPQWTPLLHRGVAGAAAST